MVVLKNSKNSYGLLTIIIHWLSALLIYLLFALGIYMADLDYMSPYYQTAPEAHMGVGFLVLLMFIFRLGWHLYSKLPDSLPMPSWQELISKIVHKSFYVIIVLVCISGYLIPTAKGESLSVFGLFEIPATLTGAVYGSLNQEDFYGKVHWYLAIFVVVLSMVHAGAAFKHHFIDKDSTLKRMLGFDDKK